MSLSYFSIFYIFLKNRMQTFIVWVKKFERVECLDIYIFIIINISIWINLPTSLLEFTISNSTVIYYSVKGFSIMVGIVVGVIIGINPRER
jgi:hypothetical protein